MITVGSLVNGKYRLVRLLGDGGMGSVYEGTHEVLGTRVAIKVLHPELARRTGLVERFLQEARVAAQIKSPHVVQVLDVDRTPEGHAFIVMELLEGEPLSSVLDRQRRLPVSTSCEYTTQILEALEAAHALGVIHRDLKPENVFVTHVGGKPILKLIDFGIAKARRTDPQQRNLTVAGVVMGTAEYMAPEQARSADKVDARADIYAVGVMLFEMIAGARPVSGEDARVIAFKVERGEVTPLVQVVPDVPRELAGFVHRAMAARPELRFASATEMRLVLAKAMSGKAAPAAVLATGAMPAVPAAAVAAPAAVAASPTPREAAGGTAELSATGTLKGAPAREVLAAAASRATAAGVGRTPVGSDPEPRIDTQRAPPVGTAMPPTPHPPYAGGAVLPAPAAYAPRRSRAPIIALITIPLLLGAGVVIALVVGASGSTPLHPAPADTTTATTTTTAGLSTTTTPSSTGSVAPLTGPSTTPTSPTAHPTSLPSTHPTVTPVSDAGLPPFVVPSTFPSAFPLPSTFPSTFPTTIPTTFPSTLPTGFPSTFPPWPQPPPQPSGKTI
jgi:serine/threonine-protein kinase